MIVIAVAGIFNTLLLNSRERVRDTAMLKAIGMSPRQVMLMVAAALIPGRWVARTNVVTALHAE
jgi:putative ABC transport system permease protein